MTKRAQTNGTLNTSKIHPKRTLKTTLTAKDSPKAAPEGAKKRPQNRPKQPLRSLQNPLHPMARKRRPAPPVLTRPPGAQTLRFPLFFHFRSTLRYPPFWGLLGIILGPDLVPVYMYIHLSIIIPLSLCLYIYIYIHISLSLSLYIYIYVYVYTYIYIYISHYSFCW